MDDYNDLPQDELDDDEDDQPNTMQTIRNTKLNTRLPQGGGKKKNFNMEVMDF